MDATRLVESLWTGGLAATPLAILAALACRSPRLRPATRHALWSAVLISFATPLLVSPWLATTDFSSPWLTSLIATAPPEAGPSPATSASAAQPGPTATLPVDEAAPPARLASRLPIESLDDDTSARCGAAAEPTASPDSPCEAAGSAPVPLPCTAGTEPGSAVLGVCEAPSATIGLATRSERNAGAPTGDLTAWFWSLAALRDTIAALPPVPVEIWAAGCIAILGLRLSRMLTMRRFLRRTSPAPADIVAAVDEAAQAIDLRSVPRVRITDERVSPMVSCGLSPSLVLPSGLWESLDPSSRRAVLIHELAHLRRCDHIMSWIEGFILAAYWWHPVAWWVRHRVREEAEACCDAWVTCLLPTSRRAYAEALVLTTSFIGASRSPGVAFGLVSSGVVSADVVLGAVSGRTRKLARRITMVMTQRTAPRMSILGVAVAALVVGLGAFVTPGLACPPEKQAEEQAARKRVRVSTTAPHPDAAPVIEFFGEAPAIEAMQERAVQQARGQTPSDPLVVRGRPVGLAPVRGVLVPPQGLRSRAANAAAADAELAAADAARSAYAVAVAGVPVQGEIEARSYRLPSGKLDALVELMSRQDVPIYISASDDEIVVNATPVQHEVFDAFLRLIHPEQARVVAGMPLLQRRGQPLGSAARADFEGARSALAELLAHRAQIEVQAEQMREQAEQSREQADHLRDLMESLQEQASESRDPGTANALHQAMMTIQSRSGVLDQQAMTLESSVANMEARLAQLEAAVEAAESRLESVEERIDEVDETSDADDLEAAFEADLARVAQPNIAPMPPTPPSPPSAAAAPAPPAPPMPPAPPSPPSAR